MTWTTDYPIASDFACLWPIVVDDDCSPDWAAASEEARESARQIAVEWLWAATARRFGLCEVTVRPCGAEETCHTCPCGSAGAVGGRWPWFPVITDGELRNNSCSSCCCDAPCQIALEQPFSIVEVIVDGEILEPEAYRIDSGRWLVRQDGSCWPQCNDFGAPAADFTGTTVTYLAGEAVPYAGQVAAGDLAQSLVRDCAAGDAGCRDCMKRTAEDGLPISVSSWVQLVNPHHIMQPAKLIVPGQKRHRVTSWDGVTDSPGSPGGGGFGEGGFGE